jgi:hypothetical protein
MFGTLIAELESRGDNYDDKKFTTQNKKYGSGFIVGFWFFDGVERHGERPV